MTPPASAPAGWRALSWPARSALLLLLAGIVWAVVVRLRVMVPFMALVLFLEPVLRAAMGALKPVETIGTAPGAALNNVVLIPLAVLLVLSITTIRPRT
jgi:hypothetical protein